MKVRTSIIGASGWGLLAGAVALGTGAALALGVAPVAGAQTGLTAGTRSGGGSAGLNGVSCTGAHACEAAGYYTNGSGNVTLAEVWNGAKWAVQKTPNPAGSTGTVLNGISCTGTGACEAVGSYTNSSGNVTLAEAWNGTKWAVQKTPNPAGSTGSYLDGVACTGAGACEAAGYYTNGSGGRETLAEAWNGTRWAIQKTPNPVGSTGTVLNGISCTGARACEAVGFYVSSGLVTLAEVWNGAKWAVQATPGPSGSSLDGVACTGAHACEAAGSYTSSSGNVTLAEVWNGAKWAVQKTPNPSGSSGSGSVLDGVACTGAHACEAAGTYQKSTVYRTLAEVWNGTKWAVQKTPNPSSSGIMELHGVSCTGAGACEAVGSDSITGGNGILAAGWNGTKWALQQTATP